MVGSTHHAPEDTPAHLDTIGDWMLLGPLLPALVSKSQGGRDLIYLCHDTYSGLYDSLSK